MAVCQSGQPIPDSTFCRRFIESVKMMACVICACDYFYLHGQTGGCDPVGSTVFV